MMPFRPEAAHLPPQWRNPLLHLRPRSPSTTSALSTTPHGTSRKTSSSTESPAPASSITWFVISSAPSSKQQPTASPLTQSQPSSPPAIAALPAPPHRQAVSSSSRSSTNDSDLLCPAPHRASRHSDCSPSRLPLAAP